MNKTLKKERLWIIGCLLIFTGAFLIFLFMSSNEKVIFLNSLYPYSLGFFISGLVTLILGFILAITYAYNAEELDTKRFDRVKIRVILITVIVIFLISFGYLMNSNTEWNVRALIIQIFNQSYALYPEFIVSSFQIFFPTLVLFGIIILPAIIVETGFLDDLPNKEIKEQNSETSQRKDTIETSNRFFNFIRKFIDSIKKYEFPIGFAFTIFGSCLIILPYFLLKDILRTDPVSDLEYFDPYYGFIRGQLLLLGLLSLIVGLIIILYYDRRRYSINKE
ncbi:MAG: hypothetical protein P8X91_05475 [Candidatus Bathyarchaeota archaeon]